jgi:RNA polymerase sigma-70 factor (ECF subfamily)
MTPASSAEELFRRYRDGGDVEALAAVFDRTAPQLLLVAAHVTPDAAAAEDLLQDAFLHAMASARQWDPGQPLLPWLTGILRHRALDLARRLRHRRAATLDAEPAAHGPGPAEAAVASDVIDRVQAAVDGLPAPYREVLVLRLVHGLEPTGIAHALGRSPSTVRVQLKRGLAQLRGVLPAALAGALAVLLSPGRGLAATRAAVLGTISRDGAPLRHTAWVFPAAAAVLVAVGVGWWWRDPPPKPTSALAAPDASGVASTAPSAASDAATAPANEQRAAPAVEGAVTATVTTLRGRIVDAVDRAPLGGGEVELSFAPGRFVTDEAGFREWPAPVTAHARADGTFAIACEPAAETHVTLQVRAPGHAPASAYWTSLRAGCEFDLGDVALARGCELRARVVDEHGAPVAGVELSIERRSGALGMREPFGPWSSFDTTSGADGRLPNRVLPVPAAYGIAAGRVHAQWRVVRPTEIVLGSEPVTVVDVVVAPVPAREGFAGRVVDARGNPVAGVTLSVAAEFLDMGSAVSGPDGAFALATELRQPELPLYLPAAERRFRLLEPERRYRRGATDLEVRVAREPAFDVSIAVVDARSGAPVTSYGLRWSIDWWTEALSLEVPPERVYFPAPAEPRPAGRAVLPQLAPGGYRVSVHPADNGLAVAYLVPFEVGANGADEVRVALQPFAPLRVVVRDEAGAAVPGVDVAVVHDLASDHEYTSLFTVEQLARGVGGGRRMKALLHSCVTDPDGRVVLSAPANEPRLRLRVSGASVATQWVALAVVPPDGAEVAVTAKACAQVVGRAGPADVVALLGPTPADLRAAQMVRDEDSDLPQLCPKVYLQPVGEGYGSSAPLLPDGSFRLDAVPPGSYRIVVDADWMHTAVVGEVAALRGGEVREVAIDVSALRPARVRGTVLVDGVPWTRGSCDLLASDDGPSFATPLDANGAFDRVVAPGRYLPYATWQDDRGTHHVFATQRVELRAGADVALRVALTASELRLVVRRADGSAAAKQTLRLRCVDFPEAENWLSLAHTTDDSGTIVLAPAPPGRLELSLPGEHGARLGEAAAAAGAASTTVTLHLPR